MPDTPRKRENTARRGAEWQKRAQRAAELTRQRTGVPVEPLEPMGGLWAPLEAVEAWLGIEQPASPPLLPQARPEIVLADGTRWDYDNARWVAPE